MKLSLILIFTLICILFIISILIFSLIGQIGFTPMPNLAGLPHSWGVGNGHELGRVRDDERVVQVDVAVVQHPEVFVRVQASFTLADFRERLGDRCSLDII